MQNSDFRSTLPHLPIELLAGRHRLIDATNDNGKAHRSGARQELQKPGDLGDVREHSNQEECPCKLARLPVRPGYVGLAGTDERGMAGGACRWE